MSNQSSTMSIANSTESQPSNESPILEDELIAFFAASYQSTDLYSTAQCWEAVQDIYPPGIERGKLRRSELLDGLAHLALVGVVKLNLEAGRVHLNRNRLEQMRSGELNELRT